MQHEKIRLQRITKANFILGYIAVGLALLEVVAFFATLILGHDEKILTVIFIIFVLAMFFAGIIAVIIVATTVLGGIQISLSKKLGSFGGIKSSGLIATFTVCDVISLASILTALVIDIIYNIENPSNFLMQYQAGDDLQQYIFAFVAISLVGCLVQAIFNSVYYAKVRGPKQKKKKTKVKKSH